MTPYPTRIRRTPRAHRPTALAIVAGTVVTGLVLSGCASSASNSDSNSRGSSGTSGSMGTVGTPLGNTSDSTASSNANAQSGASSPLSSIVLRRSDVPSDYQQASPASTAKSDPADDALHDCLGQPKTSGERTESLVSASYGTEQAGVVSSAARYSSQEAVDRDAKLLSLPKAKECFAPLLVKNYHGDVKPADMVSRTVEVRPGTNDGPKNEAGTVSMEFAVRGNGGARTRYSFSMVFLTGPKLEATVLFLGYGKQFDDKLSTKLLFALAARAAKG
jgi:hypothetical protein